MKKFLTVITSALLSVTMLVLAPTQVIASAAEAEKKYISEVKVGRDLRPGFQGAFGRGLHHS